MVQACDFLSSYLVIDIPERLRIFPQPSILETHNTDIQFREIDDISSTFNLGYPPYWHSIQVLFSS